MEKIRGLLDKATKVVIEDRENECLWRNKTGGAYGFWTVYKRTERGWEVRHYTTSSFDYCEIYGYFTECENCPEYDYDLGRCIAQPEIISMEELVEEVCRAIDSEFKGVEIYINDKLLYRKEAKIGCKLCRLGLH